MVKTQFERFMMIMKSVGLIGSSLVESQNMVDFAFIVYLHGRAQQIPVAQLETIVRQGLIMPMLTGQYSGQTESAFDLDIRQINSISLTEWTSIIIESELSESFWTLFLPQQLQTSSVNSPSWNLFCAAQSALGD